MQNNLIIDLLGIKDSHVDVWHTDFTTKTFHVWLQTKTRFHNCPNCKNKTKRVHSYREQLIQGRMIEERPVLLHVKKRRYLCTECHHTFYEKLGFVERYQRYTKSLETQAMVYVADMSFTAAAKLVGMTANRVLRLFDRRHITPRKVLPQAIAIDEFKGDAGKERFQTIIVDVQNKEVIDVLPNRKLETIENYFKQCDTGRVQTVVMDLSKGFKDAVQRSLGSPTIIADRFHFMRQGYWAFDAVRRKVQQALHKEGRILCKRNKELFWLSPTKLTNAQSEKVTLLLANQPLLKEAYELKNALDKWFKMSNEHTAKSGLEEWFQLVEQSGLEEFLKVVQTFKRWKREILQAFMYPYNNGYIEGVNNTTKVIKRNSYGIKNFQRLRKKILWRQMVRNLEVI